MKRETIGILLLAVAIGLLLAGLGFLVSDAHSQEVYFPDGRHFAYIPLPAYTYICTAQNGEHKCITTPPGCVLLIPIPDSAPVDSLGGHS